MSAEYPQFLGCASALIPWMDDERVTDILINGPGVLYVEASGRLERHESPFKDRSAILDFVERMLTPLGRRIDAACPFADGALQDGSRFHVILPPLATHGPCISIRKLKAVDKLTLEAFGTRELVAWLRQQIRQRKNLLVAGGTGAGKTTLLSLLLNEVSAGERITVIEESREICTSHPHVVSLEGRPATPDGKGAVSLRTLMRNALRMRPDRIVVGECRGEEAFDMLQAMSTGHRGSLGTVHANHTRDGLKRLEVLSLLSGIGLSSQAAREWVGGAVESVVHLCREGTRRWIREAVEVQGLEGEVYRLLPRFRVE